MCIFLYVPCLSYQISHLFFSFKLIQIILQFLFTNLVKQTFGRTTKALLATVANLQADLGGSDFSKSDLTGASLEGANLEDVNFENVPRRETPVIRHPPKLIG